MVSIFVGNTNPRKTFDEQSLKELAQSIQDKGVLQPILVRPHSDGYELVCGERRYKASIMAGLSSIPANIRELSDDEAFEMQIIENLERKDVHPLEEADAFKRMLDSGKYQIADIAAKFAKPETFIAQRLKFVDLIDEIKKDFYEGKIGIGHAIHIARLGEKDQKQIYDGAHGGWNPGYGTVAELKDHLEDETYNLDEAPFDTKDDTFPKVCSCFVCPKRSGANPTLFADIEDKNRCFDTACYDNKMEVHISRTIAKIIENGEDVLFGRGYNTPEGFVKDLIAQYKLPVLKEYDDFSETSNEGGRQLFYVSGSDAGKMVMVRLYGKKASAITGEEPTVQDQINKIEERAKRALELDDEKVWNVVRNFGDGDIGITMKPEEFLDNDKPLSDWEKKALALAINSASSYGSLKGINWFKEMDMEKLMTFSLPDSVLNQAMRRLIYDKLNSSYGSHTVQPTNAALFQVFKEYFKSEVSGICDHFQDKAEKRIARTNAKLKELKGEGDREDTLETRLEKYEELGFVADHEAKELNRGGIGLRFSDIEKQTPSEFKTGWEATEAMVNRKIKPEPEPISEEKPVRPKWPKVSKRYSLNNSYFKNRSNDAPESILDIAEYLEDNGELPFDYDHTSGNWMYEAFVEKQKRSGVYHSQYFTPPSTAQRMSELAHSYFHLDEPLVLDACCGFGMLTKHFDWTDFIVHAFDFDSTLVNLYEKFTGVSSVETSTLEDFLPENKYKNVIANPPYEVPTLTVFLERLSNEWLEPNGIAVLLVPKGFIDKDKPKKLVEALSQFEILAREDMSEEFARTKINAEIVVLQKKE